MFAWDFGIFFHLSPYTRHRKGGVLVEIGELFLLAIGLSMDACAVAASNGISHRRLAPGSPWPLPACLEASRA